MENQDNAIELEDAVGTLVRDLPKPVRDFLLSDSRAQIARELTEKYHLHLDQGDEFERLYINMLLGISTPEEFVSSLSKAGLTQDVINGLAADVNEKVFLPLRDAERRAATAPIAPKKPDPLPPPALDYQPATTLPGSPVPAPMPVAPAPAAVMPPAPPAPAPMAPAPVPQQHIVHTAAPAAHPPGWHPAAAVHIFVPSHGAPIQHPQPATPAPTPVPEVAPAAYVAPAQEPLPPQPAPTAPATPPARSYAADPYREPF